MRAKYIYEAMMDILKPKSEKDIKDELTKRGFKENVVNLLIKNGYEITGFGIGSFDNRLSKNALCFLKDFINHNGNYDCVELRIDNFTTEKEIKKSINDQKEFIRNEGI
jgi:hypothetical protein